MKDDVLVCLDLEHEAVWLFAYLGARVDATADSARRSYDAHRDARDRLLARVAAAGLTPRSPAFAYSAPPTPDAGAVRAAAREIEQRCATAYLELAGSSEGTARTFAIDALSRAAVAAVTWGSEPVAFPGLPLSPR